MKRVLRIGVLGTCLLGGMAAAHVWYVSRGVHFKSENIDFGSPPPKFGVYWNWIGWGETWRAGTDYLGHHDGAGWEEGSTAKDIAPKGSRDLIRAQVLENKGKLSQALSLYRRLNRDPEARTDFIQIRTEVLSQASSTPRMKGLNEYLSTTRKSGGYIATRPSANFHPFLYPYLHYSQAVRFQNLDGAKAALLFERLAKRYPGSPRAEAALIMVPRCLLTQRRDEVKVKGRDLLKDCRRSDSALRTLLSRFPRTRFRPDAYGWLGRIDFLRGRLREAAGKYRKQLALEPHGTARIRTLDSLALSEVAAGRPEAAAVVYAKRFRAAPYVDKMLSRALLTRTIRHFDSRQAYRFTRLLLADSEAFPVYFDLRVDTTEHSASARKNLCSLAEAWIAKHPKLPKAAAVRARVAEVHYFDGRLQSATSAARKVLQRTAPLEAQALAHYILGSCARRKSRFTEAEGHYRAILSSARRTYLGQGAREALAIVLEKQGRLGEALDEYFKLGYEYDVAYLLDAKMSPEQVARYASRTKDSRHRQLAAFSAGIRFLRGGEYRRATSLLAGLRRSDRRRMAGIGVKDALQYSYEENTSLKDPLLVAESLHHLERQIRKARGSSAKAAALLQKARYFYDNRNLALYNISLWGGGRAYVIGFSWNRGLNGKEDEAALRKHHYEHECMAHSLRLCLEIARKHPKSPSIPSALYLGIKSASRLSTLNPWWRGEQGKHDMLGEAIQLCRQFMKSFPKHPLAARIGPKIAEFESERARMHADNLAYPREKNWPGF